jgi:oligoendopeptidase F
LRSSGSLTQTFKIFQNYGGSKQEIDHGTCMYKFQQRLKNFKAQLKRWNKNVFGNILQRKQEIEQRLETMQNIFITGERMTTLMMEEEKLRAELEERKGTRRNTLEAEIQSTMA